MSFSISGKTAIVTGSANGIGLSMPDFMWGLILILFLGVLWPIFHISGRVTPSLLGLPTAKPG